MARQTRVRGLLWYDSTINNAKNHFLRPELNALISIRKDAALAERPPALFRANVRCRPSAVSVGIMLQRCRLSMHGTSGEDIEIGTLTANNALVSNSTATTFVLRVRIRTGNDTPRQYQRVSLAHSSASRHPIVNISAEAYKPRRFDSRASGIEGSFAST
jgi:hypothetical protein